MQWDEKKISRLFQIGKSWDERHAPPFERVLAHPRTTLPGWRGASLASAGLVGVALVGVLAGVLALSVVVSLRGRQRPADPLAELQTRPALLRWRSPTDFLLQTPGHELRDSLPQVGQTAVLIGNSNIQQAVPQPPGEARERKERGERR